MSSHSDRDSYGITVDGEYKRPILPEKIADIGRYSVTVNPGGTVQGGVLCSDIDVKGGPFAIQGSVMALGSFMIRCDADGSVDGPTAAGKSLLLESQGTGDTAVRFIGDVSASRVSLDNAVVYGNVFGTSLRLKNSIVLGTVFSDNTLELENVLCLTFLGEEVKLGKNTVVLGCSASSNRTLEVQHPVRAVSFVPWKPDEEKNRNEIRLGQGDVKSLECEKNDGTRVTKHIINAFDRITNLSDLKKRLALNINWLEDELNQVRSKSKTPESYRAFEETLWDLLKEK